MANERLTHHNLLFTYPILAKEWHPTRNGSLTAKDVSPRSHRKVWWTCSKGHEWEAALNNRTAGRGCPYCAGKVVGEDNCLQAVNPVLAKEWHPTRNASLTAKDVGPRSHKKVWWVCRKGHEWEATVSNRAAGKGCPYCAGKAACDDNCLQTVNPVLAQEWHPTKNGSLTAKDVTAGSNKKVWWRCVRGHDWEATIASRAQGNGCPSCHSATSALELRMLCELKYIFKDVKHRARVYGKECDIFIPGSRVAIEYDGVYWHRGKLERDKRKNASLGDRGVTLIRVREKGLEKTSDADIFVSRGDSAFNVVSRVVKRLGEEKSLSESARRSIGTYIERNRLANDSEYKRLWDMLPCPLPGLSLEEQNPKLAAEWHSGLNGSLTARDVSSSSNKKVWWRCRKGHEWEATVGSRNRGNGCPYCAGRAASQDYCLETVNPVLANEWHPTRNGGLTAKDVTPGSKKKAWWRCVRGHEWPATIASRSGGRGCPYCAGKTASEDNCLETLNPVLANEWHPTRNGGLTARDTTPGSNRKVWWTCVRGHEWLATVASRSGGRGCPYCAGKAASEDNCLETLNPVLANEWHPTRNGGLTARDTTPGSNRKVWWICHNGHEWLATIADRSGGNGCPYCAGKRHRE